MVVTEAIAGLSAIKTALDMAKALENIQEAVARDRAVFELQREILSAQQAQFVLVDRIRDLEKQIADFDEWKAEKKRYEMKEFGGGTIAYALKPSMANGEPLHNLCCKCYNNGKKGVLQSRGINAYRQQMVKCSECDADFALGARAEPRSRSSNSSRSDFDPFTGR
jgi:hypothetical protein